MSEAEPLAAVFFDIGGTLGTVTSYDQRRRLHTFGSSAALLQTVREVLGLQVGVITNIPTEMTTQDVSSWDGVILASGQPDKLASAGLDLAAGQLGVYGGMNENFVLVAGGSRWQADGV
jgi:hypothetical protein